MIKHKKQHECKNEKNMEGNECKNERKEMKCKENGRT
jgi:hypothetical protein